MNRRHFLTATSGAAALALLPPVGAEARPAIASELRAILDRRVSARPDPCPCAACDTVRSTRYECATCGYIGAPDVFSCSCEQERLHAIAFHVATLRTYPTAATWPREWRTTRAEMRRALRRLRRAGPAPLCDGTTGNCCHLWRQCPVCGAASAAGDAASAVCTPTPSITGEEACAILRDVRAVLRARGLV